MKRASVNDYDKVCKSIKRWRTRLTRARARIERKLGLPEASLMSKIRKAWINELGSLPPPPPPPPSPYIEPTRLQRAAAYAVFPLAPVIVVANMFFAGVFLSRPLLGGILLLASGGLWYGLAIFGRSHGRTFRTARRTWFARQHCAMPSCSARMMIIGSMATA